MHRRGLRTHTNFVSGQGKHRASTPRGTWRRTAVPDARASSSSVPGFANTASSKGLRMQVIGPQGEQHHGCGTAKGCGCRSSVPRASNTTAAGRRATLQRPPAGSAGDRRSDRPTRRRDRDFPPACEQPPVPRHTSAHICPAAGAACGAGHAGTPLGRHTRGRGAAHLLFIFSVVSIAARILVLLPVFAMLAGGQEDNILSIMDVI